MRLMSSFACTGPRIVFVLVCALPRTTCVTVERPTITNIQFCLFCASANGRTYSQDIPDNIDFLHGGTVCGGKSRLNVKQMKTRLHDNCFVDNSHLSGVTFNATMDFIDAHPVGMGFLENIWHMIEHSAEDLQDAILGATDMVGVASTNYQHLAFRMRQANMAFVPLRVNARSWKDVRRVRVYILFWHFKSVLVKITQCPAVWQSLATSCKACLQLAEAPIAIAKLSSILLPMNHPKVQKWSAVRADRTESQQFQWKEERLFVFVRVSARSNYIDTVVSTWTGM